MPWIKLDDQWIDHPKVIRAGRDARDIWLASLTYCARHLTDGYFSENLLPQLAVMAGVDVANCQNFATRLLDVGLWERTADGYHIHDYTDYNPTKEQAEATKKARSEAGRVGGIAKSSNSKQNPGKMLANDVAKSKQNSAPSPSPSPSPYPYPSDEEGRASDENQKPSLPKDVELVWKITGICPGITIWDEIILNVQSTREKRNLSGQKLKDYLKGKYDLWCSSTTEDGRPYNPSNWKWLEWAISNYIPKPPSPPPAKQTAAAQGYHRAN